MAGRRTALQPQHILTRHPQAKGLALLLALIATPWVQAAPESAPLEMRAQLTPQHYATLATELGAKINRIHVREGEAFKAGQPLVEFDCGLQQAQLDKAKAQLYAAENTYGGNQHLAGLNAIGQVELRNSEAEVMKAKADVAYLQTTLDKCTILAPYDGQSGEQKAREQQFVQPGQALMEVLDNSTLELEFLVPTQWLRWFQPGHQFQVVIEDTGKNYPVKLLRTAAKADPVSQLIKAIAVIDGDFPELVAGMSGRILLEGSGK